MTENFKSRLQDFGMMLVAVMAGAGIIHFGDRLLDVRLELFWGVSTFTPAWVLDLFFVPFVAGMAVSFIYGLGGKIIAHFCPLIVRIPDYYELSSMPASALPENALLLPMGYWILIVIMSVEFAAFGGVVGEILIKKVYGRSPRHLLHKKYAKDKPDSAPVEAMSNNQSNGSK